MSTECYPIAMLPNTAKLYRDFVAMGDTPGSPVRAWYGAEPLSRTWMRPAPIVPHAEALADALHRQSTAFGAGPQTLTNISKLRTGARAVVTGQQVGLLGGPLLVLLKAATAIARAKQATDVTGIAHVPVFWCATEDHDLEEADQVTLLSKTDAETLRLPIHRSHAAPVGAVALGSEIDAILDRASELLGYTPVCELLRECYRPDATFGTAFARLLTRLFAEEGLIVMDAAGRDFHALGAAALRGAIEHAGDLESALLARSSELESAGYHAQVLVKSGASLLFFIADDGSRVPLRRSPEGAWKAGAGNSARQFSTEELLALLAAQPERLSPNALLRPVFQDSILPTTAYIGGPAEIAYFAQSAVLYDKIIGRVTPILPRLSATVIEPAIGEVMARHEVSLRDVMQPAHQFVQRLGARAMPLEAKRRLASAGDALDEALKAAEDYLGSLDPSLGRSAEVSGSKMRYQMSRLRRLAANYALNKEASLSKHANAMALHLFPDGHPQERVIAGAWFLSACEAQGGAASGFVARLVQEAANQCPGHIIIRM
jgi:bacillithiol biosynthesis cysteine-adding enzyme BshC